MLAVVRRIAAQEDGHLQPRVQLRDLFLSFLQLGLEQLDGRTQLVLRQRGFEREPTGLDRDLSRGITHGSAEDAADASRRRLRDRTGRIARLQQNYEGPLDQLARSVDA